MVTTLYPKGMNVEACNGVCTNVHTHTHAHTYIRVDCRHILEMESLGRKEAGRMGKGIVVVEG